MAVNMNRDIEAPVETEIPVLQTGLHGDMRRRLSSCRRRLLFFGWVLLHLGCLGYSLYLIWLLAYLKDNRYYWFVSFIPFVWNLLGPFVELLPKKKLSEEDGNNRSKNKILKKPSFGVIFTLIVCFTMLTRVAYYHRQPDEFIGPRFVIMSLQGSIILIVLNCFLQRACRVKKLLNFKDTLTRMLLDFVDIFNMVEILSANECVGVGSFVSEESSTEKAIQAFCTLSFLIVFTAVVGFGDAFLFGSIDGQVADDIDNTDDTKDHEREKKLHYFVQLNSFFFQNLPFLVIRIVVWAQYRLYNLGFLLKNVFAIIFYFVGYCQFQRRRLQSHAPSYTSLYS